MSLIHGLSIDLEKKKFILHRCDESLRFNFVSLKCWECDEAVESSHSSSQEILCTGPIMSVLPRASSSSSSGSGQTQSDPPGYFTPTLATHFDETLIRHIQGWPSENTEKQVGAVRPPNDSASFWRAAFVTRRRGSVSTGGSVARGLPQHGQPVHVWNLHGDEEPPLSGQSVWNPGYAEGTEVGTGSEVCMNKLDKRKPPTEDLCRLLLCVESCFWGSRAKSWTNWRTRTPTWCEDLRESASGNGWNMDSKPLRNVFKRLQPATPFFRFLTLLVLTKKFSVSRHIDWLVWKGQASWFRHVDTEDLWLLADSTFSDHGSCVSYWVKLFSGVLFFDV